MKGKRTMPLLSMAIWLFISCGSSDDNNVNQIKEELIFNSGFEGASNGFPELAHADIFGIDNTLPQPNSWDDFDGHPNIGDFTIQYEGGIPDERFALITADPVNPNNQVLQFWLKTPNVIKDGQRIKGRIQTNLYHNTGLKEILFKGKFFFHPESFNLLTNSPHEFDWLTIFEFWNNPNWIDEPNGFRITINIEKLDPTPGTPLVFGVHGQTFEQDRFTNLWAMDNTDFIVPVGQWLDYQVYFKEGDDSNGRFFFEITNNGIKTTIFDITDFTHHPNDPSPDGLSHFNPMKLYTSNGLIDYVRSNGEVIQIFWDDFALWKNKRPD